MQKPHDPKVLRDMAALFKLVSDGNAKANASGISDFFHRISGAKPTETELVTLLSRARARRPRRTLAPNTVAGLSDVAGVGHGVDIVTDGTVVKLEAAATPSPSPSASVAGSGISGSGVECLDCNFEVHELDDLYTLNDLFAMLDSRETRLEQTDKELRAAFKGLQAQADPDGRTTAGRMREMLSSYGPPECRGSGPEIDALFDDLLDAFGEETGDGLISLTNVLVDYNGRHREYSKTKPFHHTVAHMKERGRYHRPVSGSSEPCGDSTGSTHSLANNHHKHRDRRDPHMMHAHARGTTSGTDTSPGHGSTKSKSGAGSMGDQASGAGSSSVDDRDDYAYDPFGDEQNVQDPDEPVVLMGGNQASAAILDKVRTAVAMAEQQEAADAAAARVAARADGGIPIVANVPKPVQVASHSNVKKGGKLSRRSSSIATSSKSKKSGSRSGVGLGNKEDESESAEVFGSGTVGAGGGPGPGVSLPPRAKLELPDAKELAVTRMAIHPDLSTEN